MKNFIGSLAGLLAGGILASTGFAQTNFNVLTPLTSFGPNGDGSLRAGQSTFVATGDRNRGMAFNPVNGNIILIDRQTNGNNSTPWITGTIDVMNGTNGTFLNVLNTNTIDGTARGDFANHCIAVADDGVVYMANLVNNSSFTNDQLQVWRWNSDSTTNADGSDNVPFLCYSNNPGGFLDSGYGINMDVRGSGPNTQIIFGSRDGPSIVWNAFGKYVAVLTTDDGTNFVDHTMSIDQASDSIGRAGGLGFGAGDTFWAVTGTRTTASQTLWHMQFDTNAGTATTLQNVNTNALVPPVSVLGSIAVDPVNNLLAMLDFGIASTTPDHVRLYDIEDPANPVLLDIKDFPVNRTGTAVGFLDFGGTNLYVHSMNCGLMAFAVTPGAGSNTPPAILTEPLPAVAKLAPGGSISYQVIAARALGYQWQHNGTNLDGQTGFSLSLASVSDQDTGSYQVIVTNAAGATTSSVAVLQLTYPDDTAHVFPLWNISWLTRGYLPQDAPAGNTPFTRSFTYNAVSNQLILVCRSNSVAPSPLTIPVLDADTGNDLYTLKTNNILFSATGGTLNFPLNCIAAADDGTIYASSTATGNANTNANSYRIYRWTNSDPNTVPVLVRSGDPVGTNNSRWGDSFCVRGSGMSTMLAADAGNAGGSSGTNAAVFAPTDATLNTFTSLSNGFLRLYNNGVAATIGRSIQFGPTNSILQKRKNAGLEFSSYDLTTRSSTLLTNFTAVSSMGPVAVDIARHLLAGITFKTGTASDSLDVYDISDPSAPVLIGSQDFPLAHQPNANAIGQVIIGQNKIFALDANNGIVALTLVPALVPNLTLAKAGNSNTLSWTNSVSGWTLQSTTNLLNGAWVNVSTTPISTNNTYVVTDIAVDATKFYRLIK